MEKNHDALDFIKRRVLRIGPTWWCFLVFFTGFQVISYGVSLRTIMGNFLGVQYFTGIGNPFNWYIYGVLLLYIFAPYLKGLVDRIATKREHLQVLIVLIAYSVVFWRSNHMIIIITRFVVFYLGMVLGKACKKELTLPRKTIFGLLLLAVFGGVILKLFYIKCSDFLWDYGLHWYPFVLIVPGLCIFISYLMCTFENNKAKSAIEKLLSLIGKNSLEVYLVHLLAFEVIGVLMKEGTIGASNFLWVIAVLLTIVGCIMLKGITYSAVAVVRWFRKKLM